MGNSTYEVHPQVLPLIWSYPSDSLSVFLHSTKARKGQRIFCEATGGHDRPLWHILNALGAPRHPTVMYGLCTKLGRAMLAFKGVDGSCEFQGDCRGLRTTRLMQGFVPKTIDSLQQSWNITRERSWVFIKNVSYSNRHYGPVHVVPVHPLRRPCH